MATQVIVVDDDPIVGSLTQELLRDAGFEVRLISDSLKAQDEIKREQPSLVVLDILMPGIDGLTLLHRLKADPLTKNIRAIVVSGKSFAAEKTRALQYGAELFIEKPYDVDSFGTQVTTLMRAAGVEPHSSAPAVPSPAPGAAASPSPAAAPRPDLKLAIWGCRSAPSASSTAVSRYGKNTACVSVELPQHIVIFDAGTGILPLGADLMTISRFKELWIFLTNFHRDHVEGLATFPCARDASYTLNISGAGEPEKPVENMLAEAFAPGFGSEAPPCRIELYEMIEQTYAIMPGVNMTAFYANHPGTTLGYVLQTEGRKIAYCPASEVYGEDATALQDYDEKLGGLVRGCDVLIHDGRYTEEDYKKHRNTGHSSFLAAVDFAGRNAIKQLILVHQDESYSDEVLDKMAKDAGARVAERGYAMKVAVGREGLRLSI
jgi:CheY-like chemotaxis protein/phosphoribosyl 1,2-cyclic phosphodiesterase